MDRVGAYNYNRILFYEERKKETPVTQMLRQDTRLQLSIYCNFSYIYIRRCFVFHNPPAFALTLGPVAIVMLLFFFPLPPKPGTWWGKHQILLLSCRPMLLGGIYLVAYVFLRVWLHLTDGEKELRNTSHPHRCRSSPLKSLGKKENHEKEKKRIFNIIRNGWRRRAGTRGRRNQREWKMN